MSRSDAAMTEHGTGADVDSPRARFRRFGVQDDASSSVVPMVSAGDFSAGLDDVDNAGCEVGDVDVGAGEGDEVGFT